jgi:hypothetical protein
MHWWGLDLPIYRRPARLSNKILGFRRLATRAHLSVDFRRWDPSWIPGFPFGRLASDKTCGVRACESQSKRGLYATCWTPERPPQQSPTPSLVKSTPVKKGKNVKKESKQEVKPEIKVRAALHSYASW